MFMKSKTRSRRLDLILILKPIAKNPHTERGNTQRILKIFPFVFIQLSSGKSFPASFK